MMKGQEEQWDAGHVIKPLSKIPPFPHQGEPLFPFPLLFVSHSAAESPGSSRVGVGVTFLICTTCFLPADCCQNPTFLLTKSGFSSLVQISTARIHLAGLYLSPSSCWNLLARNLCAVIFPKIIIFLIFLPFLALE